MTSEFMKLDNILINVNNINYIGIEGASKDTKIISISFHDRNFIYVNLNETNLNIIEHYTGLTLQEE